VCCELADVSHDFGHRTAALEQTRAAWAYAEIIGHNSLRTWCRSMQAWLAMLDGRPQQAVALAHSGQRYAAGNAASDQRLYSMEGVALAQIGDGPGALRAFALARDSMEQISGIDDFYDEIGGGFTADQAKQHVNAANGLSTLRLVAPAVEAAETGIRL
jgi:hypothetical protein